MIDSNRFASLHPGYYVVFTGVYPPGGGCERAAPREGGLSGGVQLRAEIAS